MEESLTPVSGERRPRIAFVSQPEYFRFIYEHDLDTFAEVFELQLHMGLPAEAFAPLVAFGADYTFFFRGEFVPEGVLEQLPGLRVALSSEPFPRIVEGRYAYTADSIGRYLVFRALRNRPFDYVFHYDAASLPFFSWDGMRISGEFALPVATSVYAKRARPQEWDLFFIGRSSVHREKHFAYLKHHYNFLHICHGVFGEPLIDYLCAAKICLNVHAENEISWEPRMQMMLACGAFVISEKISPNPYLRPGIDYVEINSPRELHDAVGHYLAHDDERQRIAASGHQRVLEQFNSADRFRQLIAELDSHTHQRFSCGPGRKVLDAATAMRDLWWRLKKWR